MKDLWSDLLNFIFPGQQKCPFCCKQSILKEEIICQNCRSRIKFLPKERPALAAYEGLWQEVLGRFKYRGETELSYPLAALMLEKKPWLSGAVVPLPMHEEKLRLRGYNQTELLAGELERIGFCHAERWLIKVRATEVQAKLKAADRRKNVAGCFRAEKEACGKDLILLDDILTTGSTMKEACLALRAVGAGNIRILVWATGNLSSDENNIIG